MKEVIYRQYAIEEGYPITATVMAARAVIDSGGDVRLVVGGGEGYTFTVRHALDKYEEYSVLERVRQLNFRLIVLDGEKESILKEIEAEREYLSKAQKLATPNP